MKPASDRDLEPVQDPPSAPAGGIQFYGGYQVYSESGIDLTLLKERFKLTVTERWEGNARLLPMIEELRKSGQARIPGSANLTRESAILDLAPLLRQLNDHHVEFVVIGGLAMIAHGSAYVTKDLDVCYSRTPTNLNALVAAFGSLHPYLRGAPPGLPFHFDVPTLQAGLNFTLVTDLGDVDVLGEVSGLGNYEQVFAQSEERAIYDLTIRILSLDGLIAAKRAAGRLKDRNHLLELEELKKLRDPPR